MTAFSGNVRRLLPVLALAFLFAGSVGRGVVAAPARQPTDSVSPAGGPRVDADRLAEVGIDTAGTLATAEGALPVDMWRDTSRSLVDALLPRLPVGTSSPAMRSLMRRLLLTGAALPRGDGETGRLLDERAEKLWRMGDVADLLKLIAAVPAEGRSPKLWLLDTDARLLAGDTEAACRTAEERVGQQGETSWQKLLGFCHAIGGDADGAALTVALLAERDVDIRTYRSLIDVFGAGRAEVPKLAEPSPLELAMLRAAALTPAPEAAQLDDLSMLMAIARAEPFAESLRLAAAERTVAAGVLPAAELYPLYQRMRAAKPSAVTSRGGARIDPPPASASEIVRQALDADTEGRERTAWAARALEAGRQTGEWLQASHLVAPWLAGAIPGSNVAEFAPAVVPAMLVQGERGRAEAWIDWLAANPGNEDAAAGLLPLARLARLRQSQEWTSDTLAEWWQEVQGQPGARLRAERLMIMLQATGDSVPESVWHSLLLGPAQVSTINIDPAFRTQMVRAARLRRVGETVLLALIALGKNGPQAVGTASMENVVESLRAVGLDADARALAVEAVASR
jgi:hypothetical protein